MRITLKDPLVRNRIQERSGFTITPAFWDDSAYPWTANTPTTVDYRIDCLATGARVLDWTTVTPGTTVSIPISAAYNIIQNNCNPYEQKQITVRTNAGLSTQFQMPLVYRVENLYGQT